MNQHYFDVPFAFSGDVTAIPDPLQAGGTVSFTEGWNFNYQRNLSTDPAALPIDRSTMNWLFKQITTALQALQQSGIPEFITAAQNGGVAFPYGPQAHVLWSASGNAPFTAYVNITGTTNSNTPSAGDPQGLTTGWQISCDPIATAAQATAGTNDASIMTPLKVAQQTALRALLAGNSSQVFNVGPAVSGTQAAQLQQVQALTSGRLINVQAFAVSGTYTPTSGTTKVIIELVGGGGGGGGATGGGASVGGGGGGGAFARAFLNSNPGTTAVTVGAGGTGVSAGNGNAGTSSSFGAFAAVGGGSGGAAAAQVTPFTVTGGQGSAAISLSGVVSLTANNGAPGQPGFVLGNGGSALSGNGGVAGNGAGGAISVGTGNAGLDARGNSGAGGSGACNNTSGGSNLAGGTGGSGYVVVYEFS